MKLIRFELLKITISRGFLVVAAALLVLSGVLGYFSAREPRYDPRETDAIVESYRDDPEETLRQYEALEKEYESYRELLLSESVRPSQPPASAVRFEQYRLAFDRILRQEQYTEILRGAIRNLEKQGDGGWGKHAAVNRYLLGRYERNLSLRLGTESMEGLTGLYKAISLLYLPLMLFAIFLGVTAVYSQRERGTEALIHASLLGRADSSLAKAVASALVWSLVCILSLLLAVGTYSAKSGFWSFGGYLQECEAFMLFPIPLTVAESLLLLFGLIFACGLAFCGIAALAGRYCRNRVFPMAGTSLLLLTGLLPQPPQAGSLLRILPAANLFDGNKVFAHLYPVVVSNTPFYGGFFVLAVYTVVLFAIWGLFIALPVKAMDRKGRTLSLPKLPRRHTVGTVLGYEWKKQLFANKTLWLLLGATVLKIAVSWNILAYEPTYTDEKYRTYMLSIQGPYTEEKRETAKKELDDLYGLMAIRSEMETRYRNGEISREEMGRYLSAFYEAEHNEKALLAVAERLEELHIRYLDGQAAFVVYDVGWKRLLAQRSDLLFLLLIIGACCGLYGDEYRRGMHSLYATCAYGAAESSKRCFCVGFAAVTAGLFRCIDLFVLWRQSLLPLWNAPACGLGGFSVLQNAPLWTVFAATVLVVFAFALGVSAVVSLFSRISKNKGIAFLLSLGLLLPFSMLIF